MRALIANHCFMPNPAMEFFNTIGASRPLRRIPRIVSFLNRQRALDLGRRSACSCPEAVFRESSEIDRQGASPRDYSGFPSSRFVTIYPITGQFRHGLPMEKTTQGAWLLAQSKSLDAVTGAGAARLENISYAGRIGRL